MVKTQLTLTEEEQLALQQLASMTGRSVEELIQKAIDNLLAQNRNGDRLPFLRQAAGMWKDHEQLPAIEQLRAEWDRPD